MAKRNYDSENEDDSNELVATETPQKGIVETIELPNSNYLAIGIDIPELGKYRLKSVYMCWGKNTVIEVFK